MCYSRESYYSVLPSPTSLSRTPVESNNISPPRRTTLPTLQVLLPGDSKGPCLF